MRRGGRLHVKKKNVVGWLRRRVGIKRRVENSVGCLSEKRLFINKGNNVDDEL